MSVALLTAQEFGAFAARVVRYGLGDLPGIVQRCAAASSGNVGAFFAQYGEMEIPATAEEIERWALDYLAGRFELDGAHWGPIGYNCIADDGRAFSGPFVQCLQSDLDGLRELENQVRARQEAEEREVRRAEENAEALLVVGRLPRLSASEIEARRVAAGADRVIVASFEVNQTDLQSDYHGSRTARTVVIGFAKGQRESFRQLRQAAGAFPATAAFGPGRDIFRVRVVLLDDVIESGSRAYWKGGYSHWHGDIEPGKPFATKGEAEAFIASAPDPETISFDGQPVRFDWKIEESSFEHRENYSMGGGNYLGRSRYSGWQVFSYGGPWSYGEAEFFEPSAADLVRVREMERAAKSGAAPKSPKPSGPFWTSRGLYSDQEGAFCARRFTKQERAEEQQAKLRALGFDTEIVCGHRRNSLFLRLVKPKAAVAPVEPPAVVETDPPAEVLAEVEALAWI